MNIFVLLDLYFYNETISSHLHKSTAYIDYRRYYKIRDVKYYKIRDDKYWKIMYDRYCNMMFDRYWKMMDGRYYKMMDGICCKMMDEQFTIQLFFL